MTTVQKPQFSVKWDIRTNNPRRLWRALHDFLDDNEFEHEYSELKFTESPIAGTATFSDLLSGQKDIEERANSCFLRILIGCLLSVTIVLMPFGLELIRSCTRRLRTIIEVNIEGEVYRARATDINTSRAAEVVDVVADARIALMSWAGEPIGDNEIKFIKDQRATTKFEQEFETLSHRFDELLPQVSLIMIDRFN